MQTTSRPALLDWKIGLVQHALTRSGFETLPRFDAMQVDAESRRRIDLAFQRQPGKIILGLHRRHGDVVDMTECHVIEPSLLALLDRYARFSDLWALLREGAISRSICTVRARIF
ncbi:class I SAM-dependent RNA methyltransferase [Asaia prunellae]|uniref:hypothetical protein n=1 Tax=Asaia prunellae TaxID=610245 RepID=UPI001FB07974|nr:hypothetical protein [Asaia prunellae]